MIAMKSYQGDKYPLMFVHEFYIANRLSKDMYVGSDFILKCKNSNQVDKCGVPADFGNYAKC